MPKFRELNKICNSCMRNYLKNPNEKIISAYKDIFCMHKECPYKLEFMVEGKQVDSSTFRGNYSVKKIIAQDCTYVFELQSGHTRNLKKSTLIVDCTHQDKIKYKFTNSQ